MFRALIGEYQTKMPEKNLLEARLHEFFELAVKQAANTAITSEEWSVMSGSRLPLRKGIYVEKTIAPKRPPYPIEPRSPKGTAPK